MSENKTKLTLWGIELFVATAQERSISAAARRMDTSPATVSQQITNLETATGAVLFDRSARPISLTPAGRMFRKRAQVILNEAAMAQSDLDQADFGGLTQFKLGVIEDFDADVTPQLLTKMAQDLAECQFVMETGASHRLFDQLDARALDVIVAAEMGARAPWMEVHSLVTDPFVVVVHKDEDPDGDWIKNPLIQYTHRHVMGREIARHLARQQLTVSHRYELDSYHAIMAMVAAGQGWTITTPLGWMHAHRFRSATKVLPLPFDPLSRNISLFARQGVLGDMPAQTADHLRGILRGTIVDPMVADHPWLAKAFRVHER